MRSGNEPTGLRLTVCFRRQCHGNELPFVCHLILLFRLSRAIGICFCTPYGLSHWSHVRTKKNNSHVKYKVRVFESGIVASHCPSSNENSPHAIYSPNHTPRNCSCQPGSAQSRRPRPRMSNTKPDNTHMCNMIFTNLWLIYINI